MGIRTLLSGCFGNCSGEKSHNRIILKISSSEKGALSDSDSSPSTPQRDIIPKFQDPASNNPRSGASFSPQPRARSKQAIIEITSTPITTKALIVASKQNYAISTEIPFPTIEHDGEVIIRSRAVGLNPIDWKSVEHNFCLPSFPWITGREVAGVVVKVGKTVTDIKIGDRVWASTYYRDRRAGTFQQYVTVPQHTVLPLYEDVSFHAGASLGVAGLTAAMTIWKWLRIPMPLDSLQSSYIDRPDDLGERYILIWGGSSITGQFAIQIAKSSNLRVIAITSTKTAPLATHLGAAHVISRDGKTNEEIVAEVRHIVKDELTLAIDVVGNQTAAACLQALSHDHNKMSILAPLAFLKSEEIIPTNIEVANVEMKAFVLDKTSRIYAEMLNLLIITRKVLIPEIEVLNGGLGRIEEGLQLLKKGDRGGKKLVVDVE